MHTLTHKVVAFLLALSILAGSLALIAPSYPARALVPTAETLSLPTVLFQGVFKAIEASGYVILRKYIRQGVQNLMKDAANTMFKGGRGKGPAYETKPWDNFWEEVGNEAIGAAIEGFAQGMVNEYERQKKRDEVYTNLKEVDAKRQNLDLQSTDLENDLEQCLSENANVVDSNMNPIDATAACQDVSDRYQAKIKETSDFANTNAGKFKAFGVTGDYTSTISRLNTELGTARDEETTVCASDYQSQGCKDAHQEVLDRVDQIKVVKQEADAAFAQADPESADAVKSIDQEYKDKDAALVTGQVGALSEAGRTIVDIVCKPEADLALSIFLGLGESIAQPRRKPICPFDVLKKNWSRIITDAGVDPSGFLSERTLKAWNDLGVLVDPSRSDVGAAWRLSISGHNVKDLARQLGVTDYGAIAMMGGIKPITDLAKNTITTPARALGQSIDKSIEGQYDQLTNFVPVGHLVADILITAASAALDTTIDLIKDGLKKPQLARRKPRSNLGLAALSRYTIGNDPLRFPNADPNAGTEAFAEATLAVFDELKYTGEQSWDVLNKITIPDGSKPLCYDPNSDRTDEARKAIDPESCAIEKDFQSAIQQGLTVQQALDKGLLNENGIFGFDVVAGDEQRDVPLDVAAKNYPYDSLVILRKYRIIPVSWELAALYIKENSAVCGSQPQKNCTLEKLVSEFNEPDKNFYQMVDPNWVLKAPPTRCMIEGWGPQVISELLVDHDGNPSTPDQAQIVRGKACVDYQTCLGQDARGECTKGYGYCLQEESIMHFTGAECKPEFESCHTFGDPAVRKSLTVLTNSLKDYKTGQCNEDNAGCRWYSSERQYQKDTATGNYILAFQNKEKVFLDDPENTKVQREWSSAPAHRVFLSSSAQVCPANAAGCRQVSGPAGTPPYLRLPPDDLKCDQDGVLLKSDGTVERTIPWYKRQDCKEYTQLCKAEFEGCQKYFPEQDRIAVTGKIGQTCPSGCAAIYNYVEGKTWFDENFVDTTANRSPMWFNSGPPARRCSIAHVGCEEFTNLEEVARGGEGKEYYTYLQRCVKEPNPEAIPAGEVFYSFVGSDTAGGQPEKYYIVGEGEPGTDGYAPQCADPSKPCDCSAEDAERQKYDPRIGTILCREFVNANGRVFYRYTDNLIYRTSDCSSFRRTVEGDDALPHLSSPQFSRRCLAAALNCREYRDPRAGNVRVISYDNFENGTIGDWKGYYAPNVNFAKASNEGEVIGDHSLVLRKTQDSNFVSPTYDLLKPLLFLGDAGYQIRLNIKGKQGASVRAYLHATATYAGYVRYEPSSGPIALTGEWQLVSFDIRTPPITESLVNPEILIVTTVEQDYDNPTTEVGTVFIDDIIVKEIDGVEYLIRDTWQRNDACFNTPSGDDPTPDYQSPAYQGCSLYRDTRGVQYAIQSFERVCPNEMAGCVKARVQIADRNYSFSYKRNQDGTPVVYNAVEGVEPGAGRQKCSCERDEARRDCSQEDAQRGYAFIGEDHDPSECSEWYVEDGQQKYAIYIKGSSVIDQPLYRRTYLIPDQAKACQASDNKCTAYGSPKIVTQFKNENVSEQVRTSPNLSADNTQYEWKEKEEWNIAYFKVTPQEARHAQAKFVAGDISPYEQGICRAATYTHVPDTQNYTLDLANTGDIGCREYLSGSNKIWFRDPGMLICDAPAPNKEQWTYRTCARNTETICQDDSDCPAKDGQVDTCAPQTLDCPATFVKRCPAAANGCRKITDPNCTLQSSGKHTLKDNYGRTPGTTDSGISCKPDYYFTEDFDKRSRECDGVNPSAGCVLFDDAAKYGFEYHLCQDADCAILGGTISGSTYALDQSVSGPVSHCSCDRNPLSEEECREKVDAALSDPEYCYNRYFQGTAGARNLLRKYKKVPVDTRYDSAALYAQAHGNRGQTNLTPTVTSSPDPIPDSNTLIKIRPDRQCKVWLECSGYFISGKDKICTKRRACDKRKEDGSCEHYVDSDDPILQRLLFDTDDDAAGKDDRKVLLTLSGYARPDYTFSDTTTTRGGYSADFSTWQSFTLPSPRAIDPNASQRSIPSDFRYKRIVPSVVDAMAQQSSLKVCSNDWRKTCENNDHCKKNTTRGVDVDGTCVYHPGYLNACRLYPKQDARDLLHVKDGPAITDACRAETTTSSSGLYGFCLEPIPRFFSNYQRATPGLFISPAGLVESRGYCKKNYNQPCTKASDCNSVGVAPQVMDACVYRYYENYCLNWLPVDRTGLESVFTENDAQEYHSQSPSAPLSYCIKTEDRNPSHSLEIGEHIMNKKLSEAKTIEARKSNEVEDANVCPGGVYIWFQNARDDIVGCSDKEGPAPAQSLHHDKLIFRLTNPEHNSYDTSDTDQSDSVKNPGDWHRTTRPEWIDDRNSDELNTLPVPSKMIKKENIESISYRIDLSVREKHTPLLAKNVGLLNPGFITSSDSTNDFAVTFVHTSELYDPATTPIVESSLNAFINSYCAPNNSDESFDELRESGKEGYFTLRPRFDSNDFLYAWEMAQCGYGFIGSSSYYADVLFMSIDITTKEAWTGEDGRPNYHQEDVSMSYKDTFCKEYVTVARAGEVVGDDIQLKAFDYEGQTNLITAAPKNIPYILKQRTTQCDIVPGHGTVDRNYTPNERGPLLQGGEVGPPYSGSLCKRGSLSSADQSVYGPYILDQPKVDSSGNSANGYSALSPQYPQITDLRITPTSPNPTVAPLHFRRLRDDTPFRKIYEYWRWDGSAYKKVGAIDGSGKNSIDNLYVSLFWDITRSHGRSRPPVIYNTAGAPNKFDAQPGDINDFQLSFWVDVNDEQLPIKYYRVILPYNEVAGETTVKGDGKGWADNGSTSNRKEPMFGPFVNTYDQTKPLTGRSDLEACVEVADNWEACTKVCGNLGSDGKISSFDPPRIGWLGPTGQCVFP